MPFPICLTFDVDAEAGVIGRDPQNAERPVALSAGRYGPQTALPRILDLLDRHDGRATFFVPGWTADHHRDAIAECARRGHEVAHHGYHHVRPDSFSTVRAERDELERGIAAIERATGQRPAGYRSPAWELSSYTLRLLAELGFRYSSNMMDADGPYLHQLDGDCGPLVELPVSWTLDDWPFFGSRPEAAPSHVAETWLGEFEALREREGAALVLTMHPEVIGRPGRLAMLDPLISHMRTVEGVAFLRCAELAAAALQAAGTG
jgi:peptidoglycan/xylan/chitin deacetylase (PgdA/CDA1 family)